MKKEISTIEKLCKFVDQRAGLEYANYGDAKSYRAESREITKDRQDFYELLGWASSRIENLNDKLTDYLQKSSGRLTLNKEGSLEYCTGQYFPTEYRPAACNVLKNLIWNDLRDEMENGKPVYEDGHAIRKAARRRLSRRVVKNYFN